MIFRKETPLLALEMDDSATGEGLISQVAVRPTGKQPFRGARKMTFRVGGVPEDVQPPSDAIQRQTSDQTYTISAPASYLDAPPIALDNPEPHLLGDALVQVGNEKIQAQADAILDGIDPGWDTAMALYDWVYGNIEKKVVLSFPSAIEVLETRQGDCNEHTVLYAALARSAGLPTQIAIGVVWSEQLGGFYYHAWPEVYVDRWIPMDPTLGQPIADATHIKLLNGNIESWPRLVPYLGQLKLEILEIE